MRGSPSNWAVDFFGVIRDLAELEQLGEELPPKISRFRRFLAKIPCIKRGIWATVISMGVKNGPIIRINYRFDAKNSGGIRSFSSLFF